MPDRDLRMVLRDARDTVAVVGALIAAAGIVLKSSGVEPATIVSALTGVTILLVLLWWVRLQVCPTWRFLELALYPGKSLAATRSGPGFLWCIGRAWQHGVSTRVMARLRVEADILAGDHARWREHFDRMMTSWEALRPTGTTAFRTEMDDCIPLTAIFDRVETYFAALERTGARHQRFLSSITIESSHVAPLHLLGGQLAHFDDTWRSVLDGYVAVTGTDDPVADTDVRQLRAFQFGCWIAWGPSIPVCTCAQWNEAERGGIGYQFGYGDENTSVVLYDETPRLRSAFRDAQRRATASLPIGAGKARAPLAFEVTVRARVRRSRSLSSTICSAEQAICERTERRVVLEYEDLNVANRGGRRYYSAYLWVMLVLEERPNVPLCRKTEPWRALLPFFVHGNIAEPATYAFLKRRLASTALDAIDALCRREGGCDATFAYVSAIDESGCGWRLDCEDGVPTIAAMLQEAIDKRYPELKGRVRLGHETRDARTPDGRWYAELYSACHLPERVNEYFEWVQRARAPEPARDGR